MWTVHVDTCRKWRKNCLRPLTDCAEMRVSIGRFARQSQVQHPVGKRQRRKEALAWRVGHAYLCNGLRIRSVSETKHVELPREDTNGTAGLDGGHHGFADLACP